MKIIFTLSGNSERFTNEGFVTKPLIKIDSKTVIEHVVSMFQDVDFKNLTFIVNNFDVQNYEIDVILKKLYANCSVSIIDRHKLGPVVSILQVENQIVDDEPYIVCYCDLTHKWNYKHFITKLNESNCDGCLVTHVGLHPYRLRNINFAHLKTDGEIVSEVKEKGYYTDNPINEYASSGIYYFKSGSLLKKYFKKLIENDESVNGEYYVTLVYNQMIRDGLNVIHYPTDNYVCLGTPFDLITFKYWLRLIENKFSLEEIDFVKKYWIDYKNK